MAQVPWFMNRQIETYQNTNGIPIEKLRDFFLSKKLEATKFDARPEVKQVNERLLEISSRYPETIVMTSFNTNPTTAFLNDQLLYANSDHLSPRGSIALAKRMTDIELNALSNFMFSDSNNQ